MPPPLSSSAAPPRKLATAAQDGLLPENFEDDTRAKLQAAVRAVHAKQAVRHSLEELYRAVEDLCLHSFAARAHERLQRECEAHIDARLTTLVQHQTPDRSRSSRSSTGAGATTASRC